MKTKIEGMIPWLFFALGAVICALAVIYIPRGFELSDNGHYANSIRYPSDMILVETRFGNIVTYLYYALGANLVYSKIAGIVILLISQSFLAYLLLFRFPLSKQLHVSTPLKQCAFAVSIIGGILYYSWGLTTPSYNWLTVIGFIWGLSGVLLWLNVQHPKQSWIGAGLIGVAGGLIGWSKITSAFLVAALLLVCLVIYRRQFFKLINWKTLLAGGVGLGVVMALVVVSDGSVEGLIYKIQAVYTYQKTYGLRLSSSPLLIILPAVIESIFITLYTLVAELRLFFVALGVMSVCIVIWRKKPVMAFVSQAFLGVSYLLLLLTMTQSIVTHRDVGLWAQVSYFLTMIIVILGQLFFHLINPKTPKRSERKQDMKRALWLIGGMWLIPYLVVFGTDNPYIMSIGFASNFFVLGMVAIIIYNRSQLLALIMLFAVMISVPTALYHAYLNPYRQDVPYWEMTIETPIRYGAEFALTSPATYAYLVKLQDAAAEHGFIAGKTPVMDFTGHVPAAVYALDGRTYSIPWFLGGYPDSSDRVRQSLKEWSPEAIQSAWLLTSVDEKPTRPIDITILNDFGLDLTDYELLVEVHHPFDGERQALWKPKSVNP